MFAAGMAHASPLRWAVRALGACHISRLRLRPERLNGDCIDIDPADAGHTRIVEELLLPPFAYDLTRVGFEPAAIFDCGAHIGAFTLLARRRFTRAAITAFEPNPVNVTWLRANLEANNIDDVTVVAAAVSAAAGRAAFTLVSMYSESGRLAIDGTSLGLAYDVDVIDLVAHVRATAPASLLLKVDIEGEEARLLPPLVDALPPRCALFFETHGGNQAWQDSAALLQANGFTVDLVRQRDMFCDGLAWRDGHREV